MSDFQLRYYEYPTSLLRFPFSSKSSSLADLVDGLRTEIEQLHCDVDDLTIVGHSMGGVIARQLVMEEVRSSGTLPIRRLLLYAAPSLGSSLAKIGAALSWNHVHLKQIRLGSETLENLNREWERVDVERRFPVHYVVGAQDRAVQRGSASPFTGRSNVSVLIRDGHGSIISPSGLNDLSYIILRRFLNQDSKIQSTNPSADPAPSSGAKDVRKPDPLFEIYSLKDEQFYARRKDDEVVVSSLNSGHVWIFGQSGVGKTTLLRRNALITGKHLVQLTLSGYLPASAKDILKALSIELALVNGVDDMPSSATDVSELYIFIRSQIKILCAGKSVIILIEEFRITDSDVYKIFLRCMLELFLVLEADNQNGGSIRFAFSSILCPDDKIGELAPKLRERLRFIRLDLWSVTEISGLVNLIDDVSDKMLDAGQRAEVSEGASGSPRFIKMFYRKRKLPDFCNLPVSNLIASVKEEQF